VVTEAVKEVVVTGAVKEVAVKEVVKEEAVREEADRNRAARAARMEATSRSTFETVIGRLHLIIVSRSVYGSEWMIRVCV
jgi:hypothetical protein